MSTPPNNEPLGRKDDLLWAALTAAATALAVKLTEWGFETAKDALEKRIKKRSAACSNTSGRVAVKDTDSDE